MLTVIYAAADVPLPSPGDSAFENLRPDDLSWRARCERAEAEVERCNDFFDAVISLEPHLGEPLSHIESLLDWVNRAKAAESENAGLRDELAAVSVVLMGRPDCRELPRLATEMLSDRWEAMARVRSAEEDNARLLAELTELRAELESLRGMLRGLCERVYRQSELLSGRAEKS